MMLGFICHSRKSPRPKIRPSLLWQNLARISRFYIVVNYTPIYIICQEQLKNGPTVSHYRTQNKFILPKDNSFSQILTLRDSLLVEDRNRPSIFVHEFEFQFFGAWWQKLTNSFRPLDNNQIIWVTDNFLPVQLKHLFTLV